MLFEKSTEEIDLGSGPLDKFSWGEKHTKGFSKSNESGHMDAFDSFLLNLHLTFFAEESPANPHHDPIDKSSDDKCLLILWSEDGGKFLGS